MRTAMQKRMTAGLIAGALALIAGLAAADERGVQITNVDGTADAYVSIVDMNDGKKVILDHYRINHGETYSVTAALTGDGGYYFRWHAERTSDGKAKDGECGGHGTPCNIDLYGAK